MLWVKARCHETPHRLHKRQIQVLGIGKMYLVSAYYWFWLRKGTGYGFHAFLTCILLLLLLIQCKIMLYLGPVRPVWCFVTLAKAMCFYDNREYIEELRYMLCYVISLFRRCNGKTRRTQNSTLLLLPFPDNSASQSYLWCPIIICPIIIPSIFKWVYRRGTEDRER